MGELRILSPGSDWLRILFIQMLHNSKLTTKEVQDDCVLTSNAIHLYSRE